MRCIDLREKVAGVRIECVVEIEDPCLDMAEIGGGSASVHWRQMWCAAPRLQPDRDRFINGVKAWAGYDLARAKPTFIRTGTSNAEQDDGRAAGPPIKPEDLTFEQALAILERASEEAKRELASISSASGNSRLSSRMIEGDIRALVASNVSTPLRSISSLQATSLPRCASQLARKIVRLLPGLSADEDADLRDGAIK